MRFAWVCLIAIAICGCVGMPSQNVSFRGMSLDDLKSNLNKLVESTLENVTSELPKLPPKKIVLKVGESAEVDGINVTVEKVWITKNLQEFKTFRPLDRYSGIAEDGKFIVAEVKVVNKGNKTLYLTAHDFIVVDASGNVYSYNMLTHLFEDALEFRELRKGGSEEGKVVFLVPSNATGLRIAYSFGSIADFRAIFNFFKTRWAVWKVEEVMKDV